MMVWDKFVQPFQADYWPVAPILLGNQENTGDKFKPFSIPDSTGVITPLDIIFPTSISRDSVSSFEKWGQAG
jgi:hypothetical protein